MNIQAFDFSGSKVRTVIIDGEPLFVGKDVCDVLGYVNAADAISKHCKGVAKRYSLQTLGGAQEVRVLAEPDVLRLIVRSKLPAADAFERWVFEEVLPTIRKTGGYGAKAIDPVDLNDPASLRQVLLGYTEKVIALEQTVAQQAPKVEYAEALLGSEDTMKVGDAAKSVGLLVRRTFTALRDKGILLRDNTPAAAYVNKGYFKEVPSVYKTPDGETRSRPQARVTPRGLEFLRRFGKRHPEIQQSAY